MKFTTLLPCVSLLGLALLAGACNSDAVVTTAALNGTWTVSAWTCGSKDIKAYATTQGISSVKLTYAAATGTTTGSSIYTYTSGCVNTTANALTVTAATISQTDGAISCSASCSGAVCTAGSGSGNVFAWGYAIAANTMTMSRNLATSAIIYANSPEAGAGCAVGSTETITLTQ